MINYLKIISITLLIALFLTALITLIIYYYLKYKKNKSYGKGRDHKKNKTEGY
jgi:hypothetical protein